MTNTLTHTFDCDCGPCTGSDAAAQGMAIFHKGTAAKPVATPIVATEPIRRLPAGQRVGTGRVRKISGRQEWKILKLIKERDLTNLHLVTGQTLDPNEIPFMGIKGASALIEKMLGCPFKGTDSPVSAATIPGSEKQVSWIKAMAAERNLSESDLKLILKAHPTASKLIDFLRAMPKPNQREMLKAEIVKATENEEYVPETIIPGFYRDGDAQVWKVQFNQAGTNMYALKRVTAKKYTYEAGAIRQLTPAMFVSANPLDVTIEEAKEYGRKTGTCYMCSRELTRQESISAGIGPICASKF